MLLIGLEFGPGFASEIRFICMDLSQGCANTILCLTNNLPTVYFENVLTSTYPNITTPFNIISTQTFQNLLLKAAVF